MHLISSHSASSEECSLYHKKQVAFGFLPLPVMSCSCADWKNSVWGTIRDHSQETLFCLTRILNLKNMGLLCLMLISDWVLFKSLACLNLQTREVMSFLFISETALQTAWVTNCLVLPRMRESPGMWPFSAKTGWVLGKPGCQSLQRPLEVLLTRSVPVLCHKRPEHLLVSRFPQRWKEGGLMVRRGAQKTEDSFQRHME